MTCLSRSSDRLRALAGAGLLSLLPAAAMAQQTPPAPEHSSLSDAAPGRQLGISELTKDNYGRVAASLLQIKDVLLKEPGLVVELKRLIAKEANDNGQVVNDDDLTDQAVNDRLASDVAFRAAATFLLQRYGYLVPKAKPDSDEAKFHEAFISKRVQLLAKNDSDENAAQPHLERSKQPAQGIASCNPAVSGCVSEESPSDSLRMLAPDLSVPRDELLPKAPSREFAPPGRSRILNAEAAGQDSLSGALSDISLPLTSASIPQTQAVYPDALANPAPVAATTALRHSEVVSGELTPVAMIRKPSPYADIPSMYDLYVQAAPRDLPPQQFGIQVFRDGLRDPQAIPMDLPVGPDYVIGPGDSLSIDMWGGISTRLVRVVDRLGLLHLPEAGSLQVSGRSLGEVQQAVQKALASQFRDTSADVSVAKLRTIRVYVVGEIAEPGAYDISSLSTPLNALVAAGGVTRRGSLRTLRHYRGRQLLEGVDAYDLLLRGVTPDARKLENGDTLLVPPIGAQVTVTGMVRRPAIYELNGESTLAEVLNLAGGILPAAALKHVEVQRLETNKSRTMLSLDLSSDSPNSPEWASFQVRDGDQIHIFPIAPYNQDAIYLQGHVLRPGRYSFQKGMTLTDLVASYRDLLPEPAAHYAEIVRLSPPDFHPSVQSFDLAAALADPAAAPKLEPLDTVRIFSRFDFESAPAVWVGGEVRSPGKYVTSGQAHLRDALYLAGGLTPDASLQDAQLFRTETDGNTKILSVNLREALAGDPLQNILLQPRDRLLIHRNFERVDPPTVDVKGEVAKPGRYPLTANMRVEDLIRVAGGLKRSADTGKADLTRYPLAGQPGEHLEISMASVFSGNPAENIPLHNGDVLSIRQLPGWKDLGAAVTLHGEVQHPGTYGIQPGEKLSSVLERAGGYSSEAFPYGAILTRASVREAEEKAHEELVRRVEAQQANIRLLPELDQDQKNAKLTALSQTQATLDQLRLSPPIGRLVIHIDGPVSKWENTSADIALRDGDVLMIPKKAGYVTVNGQVFNPTAVSYRSGRSAKWYLGQAGGLTQLADKKGIFVIRADGSVISARSQSGWWLGDPLSATLRSGDAVVVPEKALNIGNRNWTALLQAAQVASSISLTVAAIHP